MGYLRNKLGKLSPLRSERFSMNIARSWSQGSPTFIMNRISLQTAGRKLVNLYVSIGSGRRR